MTLRDYFAGQALAGGADPEDAYLLADAMLRARAESEPLPLSDASPQDALDRRFDAFWAVYPRKVGKLAAKKVWARLKPSAQVAETIITAVKQQTPCEQWTKEGGRFIPNPATWLSQGRWDDELPHFADELTYVPMGGVK